MSTIEKIKKHYLPTIQSSLAQAYIGGSAAELSYYALLALIPALILIANVIPLLPMETEEVLALISRLIPDQVENVILPTLKDYLNTVNIGAISLSSIAIIWSGSTGFTSLQRIFQRVYGMSKAKNFVILRLLSFLFAAALVLCAVIVNLVFIFGESVLELFETYFKIASDLHEQLLLLFNFQGLGLIVSLFCFNLFINQVVPLHRRPVKYQCPGALVSSFALYMISKLFNIYVRFFVGDSLTSSTIGVFIVMMIWIYLSCAAVIVGAAINQIIYRLATEKHLFGEKNAADLSFFSIMNQPGTAYEIDTFSTRCDVEENSIQFKNADRLSWEGRYGEEI